MRAGLVGGVGVMVGVGVGKGVGVGVRVGVGVGVGTGGAKKGFGSCETAPPPADRQP